MPAKVLENWQATLDLLSRMVDVPAALIVRLHPGEIEVLVASHGPGNVYRGGERMALGLGTYCETVIGTRRELHVPNALKDPQWKENPGIALGMISYCGLPLAWPNGELFGTLCILDSREHEHGLESRQLLERFADSITLSLANLHGSATAARRAEEALQGREARLRAFYQSPSLGVVVTDGQAGLEEANDCFCAMLGFTREELLHLSWRDLTHPDDAVDVAEVNRVLSGERDGFARDLRFIRKDGSVLWGLVSASGVRRPDRSVECVVLVVQDITERKEAEAALRASEAHERNLFDNLDAGIVVHAPDTSILRSNARASVLLGLSPDQMRGKVAIDPGWRFVRDDGSPMPLSEYPVNQVVASARPVVGQVIGIDRPAAGGRAWVLVNAYPEFDESRALRQVVVTFVDITGRTEAEQALRLQHERLDAAALSGRLGLWDLDIVTDTAWRTPQHDRLFGYDELQPTWGYEVCLRHVVPEDRPIFQRAFEEAFATGHLHYELRISPAGQPVRWLEANGEVIRDRSGRPVRMTGTVVDITGRKETEKALAASEARHRHLFESLMDGFVVVDMDGVIRESNEVYRKMLGYSAEELAKLTYAELTPERWHPLEARIVAQQVLPRGFSDVYEKEYRRKDGTVFPVELRTFLLKEEGRPAAMWAIVRDVTDVRALQVKLAVAGRMAALGTLVSGVAHEINNPLAAEMADQGLALEVVREVREHLRSGSPSDPGADSRALESVVEALEDAQQGAARISQIVRDLTVFGRPDAKRQRLRLVDLLEGAMRWLPATVARSATIQVEDGGAPDVLASAGQVEQVLVNLVTNAAKATPEGKRDTIVVRVGAGRPGMARVEVVDHGIGIDPAIRDRIFDPFFTTRSAGPDRGTGLGLAICQAIALAHDGTLTFESEAGKGSTFRLELPAAPVEA